MSGNSFAARTFRALEEDKFRWLWYGNIFSFLGMQMQVIARGYLAFDLTGKNSALGGVMLAFGLPQLVLGLWGGVVADRFPKRRIIIVCQTVVATNSAWVAVMLELGRLEYWMLVLAGVVQGASFAFIGPARQAFIGDLVGRERIANAVVLQQLSMNSTRVIGPSIAGMLIAISIIGAGGVYFLTTLGFVASTLMMLRLPPGNPREGRAIRSPLSELFDGIGYVRRNPPIALLILTSFAIIMVGFPYQSFLAAVALDIFDRGSGALGLLSTFGAVGAVGATVLVAAFSEHPRAWVFQPLSGIAFGISLMAFGLAPSFLTALVVMLAVGALASAFQSLNNALAMLMTDHEYHGRVQSIMMLSWSLFGLASLPIGILADHIGLRETLVLQGAFCVAAVILLQIADRAFHVSADRTRRLSSREVSGPAR
ncbi:MAG TPA: MFS transporter, partial [Tepidiformaceae bacterium]|nr:MFS transporter [Tepidiformaceae bacterium]